MRNALVIVDLQKCFQDTSTELPVPGTLALLPRICQMVYHAYDQRWVIVYTGCWHPGNHISFTTRGGPHNRHGVAWEEGAEYIEGLPDLEGIYHVRKGRDPEQEQYSAADAGLHEYLLSRNVRRVTFGGVATEYCVFGTAMDARAFGFHVMVASDAIAGLDAEKSEAAIETMREAGIYVGTGLCGGK